MADPIDPNAVQAARGLRGMGISNMLNSAGSAVSSAASSLRDGAANLYNRFGSSQPAPVQPATPAPGTTPLPKIDPSMADAATPNAPVPPTPAAQSTGLRAGAPSFLEGDAGIPTLNDVIQPGTGPHAPVPEIPTLTDAIPPNHPMLQNAAAPTNPNFASGMSPERAAFNAEQGLRMGEGLAQPGSMLGGASRGAAINNAASLAEGFKPVTDAVRAGLRAAAPVLQPIANVANKVAPYALPLTALESARESYGQDYDKRLNVDPQTLAGEVGARAAGVMGDLGNTLTFGLADRLGNAMSGGGFGHSDFYNKSTPAAAPVAPPAQQPGTATRDIVGEHYGVPDDVAAFNQRMQDVGAPTVGMRAGPDGLRILGNTAPASQAMQNYTDQHMADRTAQLAAYDQANRENGMRQLQQGQIMQNPDVVKLTGELNDALRSGSPVAIQAASNARDNLVRTLAAEHQTQAQTSTTMRGQDLSYAGQRATNQLGMYNAMREQANFNTEQQRKQAEDAFTQNQGAEDHISKMLDARFTKGNDANGKPIIDEAGKNAAFAGIQHSAAALGKNFNELSPMDRERLVAGSDLAAKVNADATNWPIPWKPDVIGNVMPHDLIGLQKNSSGDYVIPRGAARGRVIPARYLDKVNADHYAGQPTDIYDSLKAR